MERRERGGGDGRRELGERAREKERKQPRGRGERDRGGEERMGMNSLHFLAKIPQTVGKTML